MDVGQWLERRSNRCWSAAAWLVLAPAPPSIAAPAPECDLAGQWRSADAGETIEFSAAEGVWSAKLVRASRADVPIGFVMFRGFVQGEDGRYRGTLVRPTSPNGAHREARAELRCAGRDTIELTVRHGIMKRTRAWHRAEEGPDTPNASDRVDPEDRPASGDQPPERKWWQRFSLAVGPGIRGEKLIDEGASNEMSFDLTLRGGGGLRSGLGLFGPEGPRDGLAPTLRASVLGRRKWSTRSMQPAPRSAS